MTPKQARASRRLISYLERHCGPHLSALLLAGFGEEEQSAARSFMITLREGDGGQSERYFEVRGGASSPLPHGQDPLLLAALIRLLFERGEVTGERCTVSLPHVELLKELGLSDSFAERRQLREALLRYENVSYHEISLGRSKKGLKVTGASHLGKVIDYQEVVPVDDGGAEWGTQFRVSVEFAPAFINNLRRGTLFDVDWHLVVSLDTGVSVTIQLPEAIL